MPTTSRANRAARGNREVEPEIDAFAAQLSVGLGLSKNTREAYRNDIGAFAEYLRAGGRPGLLAATRRDVTAYMAECRDSGLSGATVARRLMALRTFYGWLLGENAIKANPTEAIRQPRTERRLPGTLTCEQVDALVNAPEGASPVAVRDRAMLELLYSCGLRASELVSLTIRDVNLPNALLRCQGKGEKQRVVPIGSRAVKAVSKYMRKARPALDRGRGSDILFLSARGTHAISRQMLWRLVHAAAVKAGIWGSVHPHTLRHCFASHLLSNGAGIRSIQEMLGHADVSTTQIYTHVDAGRILDIHRRFHPRR